MAFLNIYLADHGYSGSQIGIIGAGYQGAIFFASPFMGVLSDKYGIKKIILVLLSVSVILLLFYTKVNFFLLLFFYTFLLASMSQSLGALIDSIAISFVRHTGKSSFGHYRLWGSVGWALATYLTGMALAVYDADIIFPLAAVVLVLMTIMIAIYPIDETNSSPIKLSKENLTELLTNKPVIIFSLLLLLYGIVLAPLNMFINLYFIDIGGNYEIVGRAFAVQAVAEIPFFFVAMRFVKRCGAEKSILLAMAVTEIRIVLYIFINDPATAVWVGLGQGFTFSLFLVAIVEYFHNLIPDNLRATGQSLLWAFHFGAGVTIGNLLIGYLYDLTGMIHVMQLSGISILIVSVLFLIFSRHMQKRIPEQ